MTPGDKGSLPEGVTRTAMDREAGEVFVSLRRKLGITSFGLNQISLPPGNRLRIHRHERQEEVYLVVEGRLVIVVEKNKRVELGPAELVRVAPSVRRQLVNPFAEPCVVVAIGADGEHEGRDAEAFTDWLETSGRPPQYVPLPEPFPVEEDAATA